MAFVFTAETLQIAKKIIGQYPHKRSAVMPLLHLAQKQNENWISDEVVEYVSSLLDVSLMNVYEILHFYTMYNKQPVGKHVVKICTGTSCLLSGADDIAQSCSRVLGLRSGETTTDDKQFTVQEIGCIGACIGAPAVIVDEKYYENMTSEQMESIVLNLRQKTYKKS